MQIPTLETLYNSVIRSYQWVVRLPFEKAYRDVLSVNPDKGIIELSSLVTEPRGNGMSVHYGTLLCSKVEELRCNTVNYAYERSTAPVYRRRHSGICEDDIEALFPRY